MSTHSTRDRLRALRRADKWYLSCGDGVLWAPPFPTSLHLPGFWDEALVLYHPFAPLFTVALLDGAGRTVALRQTAREWEPDRISVRWSDGADPALLEERFALPGGRFVSRWQPIGGTRWDVEPWSSRHLVAFTAQPGNEASNPQRLPSRPALQWTRTLRDRLGAERTVTATFSVRDYAASELAATGAIRSEGAISSPEWSHTPFGELWPREDPGGAADLVDTEVEDAGGQLYVALGVSLSAAADRPVGFELTLAPAREPRGTSVARTTGHTDPAGPWTEFFESFPRFSCSDPHLERYYDYRLYGLRLNRLEGGGDNVEYPAIAEGIGYFHVPISYSAQCHMWETRWSHDPAIAQGSLLNFLAHQRPDGSLHGRIYFDHLHHTDFYHANWGDAVLAVDAVHGDDQFRRRAYEGLARYARWLDETRDAEGSGMYDVLNHFETGQEFSSRYQSVEPAADQRGWRGGFRLKGIDATVYAHQLKRALESMAAELGRPDEADTWRRGADAIARALVRDMWDDQHGIFSDVDPRSGARTGVVAAVCFYPLLTDVPNEDMIRRLLGHLTDARHFATPFPVPSLSVSDPLFDANGHWKHKRLNCPWNGRTWPMTNSHIIEGLLRQWQAGHREVGALAATLLVRFVHMMFHEGDLARPNCYEHYNPMTGYPSAYRGVDDYQHSWVLDLLIRGVAGLEPRPGRLLIDPLPAEVDEVTLDGVVVRGRAVAVRRRHSDILVTLDGAPHAARVGEPIEIPL